MRKYIFIKYFIRNKKEFVVNNLIAVTSVVLFLYGAWLLYPEVSPYKLIPMFLAFYLTNVYYTDEEVDKELENQYNNSMDEEDL